MADRDLLQFFLDKSLNAWKAVIYLFRALGDDAQAAGYQSNSSSWLTFAHPKRMGVPTVQQSTYPLRR